MEQKKLDYLKSRIGFHFTDLNPARQLELIARPESFEFKYCALAKKPLYNWNSFGFGLFTKGDFKEVVDNEISALEEMDDDEFDQMFEVKHSDQFEPEKKEVVVIPYRPKARDEKKGRTRKDRISAGIDAFFESMEN